jgi:hypothetical protein
VKEQGDVQLYIENHPFDKEKHDAVVPSDDDA